MLKNFDLRGFLPPNELISSFLGKKSIAGIAKEGFPESVLVAFSGGADSSFLLFLLHDWCEKNGVKLFAAHVNHGIRGEEALRDKDFCIRICKESGIELFVLDADVPKIARDTGKSIESAARDVRYDFFERIMEDKKIPLLATAHNADDNMETMIFRLARGTSLRGLCGIPPVREIRGGLVVRPILGFTKEQIHDICAKNGIEYVYDSTNSDTVYTRNSIRANVLPILRGINPDACRASLRMAELLREDSEFLDSAAEKYLSENAMPEISELASLENPVINRVIIQLYSRCCDEMLEYTHVKAVRELVRKGEEHSSLSLPGSIRAMIENGKLIFGNDPREKMVFEDVPCEISLLEGKNSFGKYVFRLEKDFSTLNSHSTPQIQTSKENIYKLFTQVVVQSDKIYGTLFVRPRKNGDKIRIGGMSKDVRKLFSEKRIPLEERGAYPVVCDDEGIVWIPNIALRDGVKEKNINSPGSLRLTVMG